MSKIKSWARDALPVLTALLIGAGMVNVAQSHTGETALLHSGHSDKMDGTLTARNFRYSKARTFRYVVPAAAFSAEATTSDLNHGGYSGVVALDNDDEAVAGVSLPIRARVTRVRTFVDEGDIRIHLESNKLDGNGDHGEMVDEDPPTCPGTSVCVFTDSSIDSPVIRGDRHYGLWLDSQGASARIFKVVIYYKTRAPSPPVGTG